MHEILSNLELYICQPTDTLEKISSERNIDLNEIILLNPNLKNKEIYPGLSLNLPRLTRKFTTSKDEIKEVKNKNNCSYNTIMREKRKGRQLLRKALEVPNDIIVSITLFSFLVFNLNFSV